MKKNILEFCLSPDIGGLELCVVDYFNYFKTQTQSYLCVARDKKLDNFIESKDKFTLKRSKLFPIVPAFLLAKEIDKKEIDIVHFHWTRDIATVVLAKLISKRKPKIVQSRHMTMTRFKDDFYHKWLYKNIDTIHAVTHQVVQQLQKFIPKEVQPKIEMCYLGVGKPIVSQSRVEFLREEYTLNNSFVVGIIGRIEEGKGQYIVIDALKTLKSNDIKLLIVGMAMDEAYLGELIKSIQGSGLEDRVIFTGFTEEINEHMNLCDVTVLATPKETFGLVMIESMINYVPVIATANGGPLEVIEDGIDGLLFDRTSEQLADKIELVYKDVKLRDRLSRDAYLKVEDKFYKDKQMQKMYEVLYES